MFVPAAKQGARLYFAVQDLCQLDHMYKFSMDWFLLQFNKTWKEEEEEDDEEELKSKTDDALS